MHLLNLHDRPAIATGPATAVDLADASDGRFGPDFPAVFAQWDDVVAWARQARPTGGTPFRPEELGAPSPQPGQILAIGLNYAEHATESGFDSPTDLPPVFPKFRSSLSGPVTEVVLPPGGHVDWEVELAVVISRPAHRVSRAAALDHVAGFTIGQDLSERVTQLRGPAPQFGLGKSFPGFAPLGPALVTLDELADPTDLRITCTLDGEVMQDGRTSQMIVDVPGLIAGLTQVVTLQPGDVIFTGTPAGVGMGREPQRFIGPGQTLVSTIEGLGELRQHFIAEP